MSNKPILTVFFLATIGVAAGSAWAASDATQNISGHDMSEHGMSAHDMSEHAATMRDFGKLSVDGAHAFVDLNLARLAIYDGQTSTAKTYADEADKLFTKAKSDDSAFTKAESELMTADQVAAKKTGTKAGTKPDDKQASAARPASGAPKTAMPVRTAWLPVDGAMSLNEDYTMNPAKAKAVGDANKSLAKGDRKGAIDQLKLADVSTSIVLEVVPRDQTISDVHQATQLIDAGKYYEGSQMLRKVQLAARYDVTDIVGTPKSASSSATPPAKSDAAKTH